MATSGTVVVERGCLVAQINGVSTTLVLPPSASLRGSASTPQTVVMNGKQMVVGRETVLSGGGAQLRPGDLVRAIPANCPATFFILGG